MPPARTGSPSSPSCASRPAAPLRCSDHDETIAAGAIAEPQHFLEVDERQQLLAQTQHRRVLDPLDPMFAIARLHELEHRELRHGEALAAGLDEERGDDRQGERNLDRKGGADAGRGLQIEHQLGIDPIETLIGLGEEFPEQVVHLLAPRTTHATRRRPHCARFRRRARSGARPSMASVLPKGLISVAEKEYATARSATAENRQRAVSTTASPSLPAERTSPQSRARMPA
jgi:hypothetical protein